MINHRQALTLAASAIDFPLDATDRGDLDAHVHECASCRADLANYRHDASRLMALPPIEPPRWVRDAIGHKPRPNPVVLLAAAALLLTASAGITLIVGSAISDPRIPNVQPSVLSVPSTVSTASPSAVDSAPAEPSQASITSPVGLLLFMQNTPTYQSYQMVRIVNADGSELRTIGTGVEASWSADGRVVHTVSQDANCVPSLISEGSDASGRVVMSSGLQAGDGTFRWAPDAPQVTFIRYRDGLPVHDCGSQGGAGPAPIMDLWVMNADGSGARVLVSDFRADGAAWSPDSSLIAFLAPAKAPTPSGAIVTFVAFVRVSDGRRTESGTSNVSAGETGLAWSADGTRLAFSFTADPAVPIAHVGVVNAAEGSTGFLDLTTWNPVATAMRLGVPIWSPDGTMIAVTSEIVGSDGTITGGDILLLDAVKGGLVRALGLTDADGRGTPSWSADGRWIAYVSEIRDTTGMHPGPIVEVAIDGSDRRIVPGTSPTATDFVDGVTWVAWQPAP
jgi:hypothetical protein